MSKAPDAWADEWSTVADTTTTTSPSQEIGEEPKKITSKVTKAQKRAQQAEFNRQIWAEAEGPKQPNYFLESRNVVPHRQEFKPPPVLLSRKGPKTQSGKPHPVNGIASLSLNSNNNNESSEDEDEEQAKKNALEARKVQAAKDREEKQRKYEERRLELFGPQGSGQPTSRSGNSSPGSSTPPHSRSSTPSQRGKRGRGRGQLGGQAQPRIQQRELYDQSYSPRPDSAYVQRQEGEFVSSRPTGIQPIRAPRGPDGSGRGGFGFASRGGHSQDTANVFIESLPST